MKLGWKKKTGCLLAPIVLFALATALAVWVRVRGNGGAEKGRGAKPVEPGRAEEFRYGALDVVSAHTALMERPSAKTALLAGGASAALADAFAHAGVAAATNAAAGAKFDIVFACGNGPHDWGALSARLADGGAMAWLLDVRKTSASELRGMLAAFPCPAWRLWMPGESDWLVTGAPAPRTARLDEMMERFASEDAAMEDLAAAGCDSLAQLFANYAGSRADVEPAFGAGDLSAQVRPQFFITREVPPSDWLDASGIDEDIASDVLREIRSMQVVRRVVVEGNMLALDGKTDEAIDKWHGALLRNPGDTMLLERLYVLAVNARAFENLGNVAGAAKCYETMVAVRPGDVAAMRKLAACMKKLGQDDVAEAAERRAKELSK